MVTGRTRNAKLNIVFALLLQIVTFVRGLILPRLIIPAYGSDINGLVSSITHFLSYISLLEAGVGSVFRTSLYKPLSQNDMECVASVVNEQKKFYRKIGLILVFYVLGLCVIYPMIAKTQVDRMYIVSCILILSISTFAEYFVSIPYISLLSADQKVRISYIVNIVYTITNIFVAILIISVKADIRFLYLSMGIIGLLKPLFYSFYVKKSYSLVCSTKLSATVLEQRWNGMVHHFAFYLHSNTDSAIITVFISTAMVSVYNVYGAIVFGIKSIIRAVSAGVSAGIGNLLATQKSTQFKQTIDMFELVQGGATTVFYTITALMLIPFVRVYTNSMTDINYIQPLFGYVLILAEAIYCFRCIYSDISMNANKYKETQWGALFECITNVAISLVLVVILKLGILGAAIGTTFAMLVRYAFEIVFLSKDVVFRPIKNALKMLMVSILVSVISIVLCNLVLNYDLINSYTKWIFMSVVTSVIVGVVSIMAYTLFYRSTVKSVILKVLHKN